MRAGDVGDLRDGLDGANFVIGMHDTNEDGPRCDGALEIGRIHITLSVDWEVGDFGTKALEEPAGLDGGRMFNLRGDDVSIAAAALEVCAFERVVCRFATAAGEDDLR